MTAPNIPRILKIVEEIEDLEAIEAVKELLAIEAVKELQAIEAVEELQAAEAVKELQAIEVVEELQAIEAVEELQAIEAVEPAAVVTNSTFGESLTVRAGGHTVTLTGHDFYLLFLSFTPNGHLEFNYGGEDYSIDVIGDMHITLS
ncbi:MAG: hypothetical protein LN561_00840 [Rickettsia endosymbiont of Labidopullus appendiculatus]|nr:hypothetical protein [Rickettsia endosymbiont of Labidopullus appendiculatus]